MNFSPPESIDSVPESNLLDRIEILVYLFCQPEKFRLFKIKPGRCNLQNW
jgi:hypothetical protein